MKNLTNTLAENVSLFGSTAQAQLYTTLLEEGLLGAERLSQLTGLHRETVQRELKKMERAGTITFIKSGRNKKAQAISVSELQEMLARRQENFTSLLKPLLEAEGNKRSPRVKIYMNDHQYGLLQMTLIKLQPKQHDIQVISTHPKQWLSAMLQSKRLYSFEDTRVEKEIGLHLSCFSEFRGEVEHNNREYFAGQPEKLKRQYRYIETTDSAPMQIQVWFNSIVISIFESTPSIHIVIEDQRIAKAMHAYFKILWGIGIK